MHIEPLSKEIYEKAISLEIEEIQLNFSGGSDEGYLNVSFRQARQKSYSILGYDPELLKFTEEVEKWAWSVYHYSGNGDGCDYGDDITYNLKDKTVSSSEWYMARQDGDNDESPLVIGD